MRDQELVNKLRTHLEVVRKIGLYPGKSGIWAVIEQTADRIANQSTHIAALQQEIEKLRAQLRHLCQNCDLDRLEKLAEADKAGRLVVLPVRPVLTQSIGSMLYIIEEGEIVEDSLCEALVGMGSNGEINIFYTTLSDQISFEQADIGKTVFLTRDEAAKALEEEKDD